MADCQDDLAIDLRERFRKIEKLDEMKSNVLKV